MRGLKTMLFGITLICFSGFFLVGDALNIVTKSLFTWGMIFGLLVSFIGLLTGDESDGSLEAGGTPDDGDGSDESSDAESGESPDDESDAEDENTTAERNHYRDSRFPPM